MCGLNNEQILRQLLSKSTLTLQKAIDIAVGMETTSKDAQELRHKQVSVNKLNQQRTYHQKPKSPQQVIAFIAMERIMIQLIAILNQLSAESVTKQDISFEPVELQVKENKNSNQENKRNLSEMLTRQVMTVIHHAKSKN